MQDMGGSISHDIRRLEGRVAQLQEDAQLSDQELSALALEELKDALEGLRVLNEELEQQNRELLASQADLAESERRYQELFDQAPDGYAVTDRSGTIQQANLTLGRQLEHTPDRLQGKPLEVLIAPHARRDFRWRFQRLDQAHHPTEFETTFQRRSGDTVPALVTVHPVQDTQQNLAGFRWMVHDLTRRREREAEWTHRRAEIASHQEVLQQISEGIEDFAIYLLDPTGHVVNWNRGAQEIKGYEAGEIIGKHFSCFYPPADVEAGKPQRFLEMAAGGRHVEEEGWRVRKDGRRFWASALITALRGPGGELLGYAKVVRDLTQRLQAEADRQEHLAMMAANIGTWEWDIPTGVVIWSDNLESIHGLARGAFGGRIEDVQKEIHFQDRERVLRAINEALQGQDNYNVDYRIVLPDSSVRWLAARGRVVRDSQGEPVRMYGICMDVTQRKSVEVLLEEREERFRTLLEKSYDIVTLLALDGTVTYVSPAITPILGYTVEEFVGIDPFELIHPGDLDRVWAIFEDLTRDPGGTRAAEYRYQHKDGSYRWLESLGTNLYHDPRVQGAVIHSRDVTQRVRTEERQRLLADAGTLLESGRDPQEVLEAVASFLVTRLADWCVVRRVEEDGRLRCAAVAHADPTRRAWAREFQSQYPCQADAPDSIGRVLRTGQPELFTEISDEVLQQAAHDQEHLRLLRQVGMQSAMVVPLTAAGAILGTITLVSAESGRRYDEEDLAVAVEVARRCAQVVRNARLFQREQRAREEAQEEWRQLQALIHTSPVGVMLADARTRRFVLVNQEARRLRGDSYQPGKPLDDCGTDVTFQRPDGEPVEVRELPYWRALEYGETVHAEEITIQFPDGRSYPTLVNASPVFSEEGRIVSAVVVIQDMTPLQELEKLRNEFLGMVAHDLRVPLSTVKGTAAMGQRSQQSPRSSETQELFRVIEDQVDQMTDLVGSLLDLSRIEAGAFSVYTEPTDLALVVDEAVDSFKRGHRCRIQVQVPPNLPLVQADRQRIFQVLTNLLDNASRFSPPDSPVTIALEPKENFVTTHVTDRGPGIPSDKLPLLFRKFFRLEGRTSGPALGAGLGLAICQGIVESHGEHIWATSGTDGTGTTISFTLPLAAQTAAPPTEETRDDETPSSGVAAPVSNFRVLVVDDDPNTLRFLRRLLQGAGYEPVLTGNPEEAMAEVRQQPPDLALLDLMLPNSHGVDLMRSIREVCPVPVIFLTARAERDLMVDALKLGGDDYITKPFSESELLARIAAVLRRRAPLAGAVEHLAPYRFEGLAIDFNQRQVTVEGREVSLSATEYRLLSELARNSGRVLTHDQILRHVWGGDYSGETDLVRTTVHRLRQKLGDNSSNPRYIFTVPQVGYRMPLSPGSQADSG